MKTSIHFSAPSFGKLLVVLSILVLILVCVWPKRGPLGSVASERVCKLLSQAPDDVTSENAEELLGIAQKTVNGSCQLNNRAQLLLIRAFTFGIAGAIIPDYETASKLVASAEEKSKLSRNEQAEFLFLSGTLEGRMAHMKMQESDAGTDMIVNANNLLMEAKKMGSFEAEAKLLEGGFQSPPQKGQSEFWDAVWRWSVPGVVGSAIVPLFIDPWTVFLVYIGWNKVSAPEDVKTETIEFLRELGDAYATKVADPHILLWRYDIIRTLFDLDDENGAPTNTKKRNARVELLLGRQGGTFLGSPNLASQRRTILCTDKPCCLFETSHFWGKCSPSLLLEKNSTLRPRKEDDGLLCIPATDIEEYNKKMLVLYPKDESKTLRFPLGHPQNGCIYVQSPLQQNEYIEFTDFHWQMLRAKADELRRVLSALGATNISLRVEDRRTEKQINKQYVEGQINAADSGVSGAAMANAAFVWDEYNKREHDMEFQVSRRAHKPDCDSLTGDDFPFYREEKEWQTTAKEVCGGLIIEAEFRLAYTEDYGLSEEWIGNLGLAVSNAVLGVSCEVGWKAKESLRIIKSLVWKYKAQFGGVDLP